MNAKKDIYNYNHKLELAKERLKTSSISDTNKELINKFDRAVFMEGLSKPRRLKIIGSLIFVARYYLKKDFDKASKDDLKNIVFTPHLASNTHEANRRMAQACLNNLSSFFAGRLHELTQVDTIPGGMP